MKIVVISDTHMQHEELGILRGDVLIHCGDSGFGFDDSDADVNKLDEWFGRQKFDQILYIGGNHDFAIEKRARTRDNVFRNAVYLEDQSLQYRGIKFYGTPWVPELSQWAFYLPPDEMRKRWELIPEDTDVLITHTPPLNILDCNRGGKACGCPDLRKRVFDLSPRFHCFGHVHASAGTLDLARTTYINASMVNSQYELVRLPHEIHIDVAQTNQL
jgi:Icc-related predicted phosphoesterase